MIIGNDSIIVHGSYEPSLDTFVQLELVRVAEGELRAVVVFQDATGAEQFAVRTGTCSYTDFCLAVVRVLPISIATPIGDSLRWNSKSPGDRAAIRLHALRERAVTAGWRIPFFELLLRALERATRLFVVFDTSDTKVEAVSVSFGSAGKDEEGNDLGPVTLRGVPLPHQDLLSRFIPLPGGLKT